MVYTNKEARPYGSAGPGEPCFGATLHYSDNGESWMKRIAALIALSALPLFPQGRGTINRELIAARNKTEQELESVAIIERKVMVPMRDGKRMATDIYRPKDTSKKYP